MEEAYYIRVVGDNVDLIYKTVFDNTDTVSEYIMGETPRAVDCYDARDWADLYRGDAECDLDIIMLTPEEVFLVML